MRLARRLHHRVALLHCLPHLGVALQHHVQHPLRLEGELILAQPAHPFVGVDCNRAGAGLEFATQDLHKVDLPLPLAPIRPWQYAPPNFTETSEDRCLAPNCMAMPEATITWVP